MIILYISAYYEYFVDVVKRNTVIHEFLCNLKVAKATLL